MTGSGAAGGFDFQALVGAYVVAHLLVGDQLRWSTTRDVPIAVSFEQGGAGDDIRIELLQEDLAYEVQVKRGLRADQRLEETLDTFMTRLKPNEYGVIVVDPSSSRPIRHALRRWLDAQRQGIDRPIPSSIVDHCACFLRPDPENRKTRLFIVELDLEQPFSSHIRLAETLIRDVLEEKELAGAALDVITKNAHRLASVRGRLSREDTRNHLTNKSLKLLPETDPLGILWKLPFRTPHFVGREVMLNDIRSALSSGASSVVAIKGVSGSGKSSIATEYAHRHQHSYRLIAWINASSTRDATREASDLMRLVPEARTGLPVLIVLDDAPVFTKDERQLIEHLAGFGRRHVLVTTTHASWSGASKSLLVTSLDRDASIELLLSGRPTNDSSAVSLVAQWAGDFPLAIAQISMYASRTLLAWETILERLQAEGTKLFGTRTSALVGYEETVQTCWTLTLEQLEKCSRILLHLLVFLRPTELPLDLFSAWLDETKQIPELANAEEVDDAVAGLTEWFILQPYDIGVQCHPLLQLVVREHLVAAEKEHVSHKVALFLLDFIGAQMPAEYRFRAYVRLKSHALYFLDIVGSSLPAHLRARLFRDTGDLLTEEGLPEVGIQLLLEAEPLARQAGDDAKAYLSSLANSLGVTYRKIGDLDNAEKYLRESLALIPPEDEEQGIPAITDNLAQVLQSKGDMVAALTLYKDALELRRRSSIASDGFLVTLSNIAGILIDMDRGDEAIDYIEEFKAGARKRSEEKRGSPDFVSVCHKVARHCENLGDIETAVGLSLGALAFGRQVFGHGSLRYIQDVFSSISLWLRNKRLDIAQWFIERSLLAVPDAIRPLLMFNSACLMIAWGYVEDGIRILSRFVVDYSSNNDLKFGGMVSMATLLVEENTDKTGPPSLAFIVPPGIALDVPEDLRSPSAVAMVNHDFEVDARR